jgi:hypothetical protein
LALEKIDLINKQLKNAVINKIKSIAAFRVFLAITSIAELATKQKPNT